MLFPSMIKQFMYLETHFSKDFIRQSLNWKYSNSKKHHFYACES